VKLTTRQIEVLLSLSQFTVAGSGTDGSVLHSLARKGLVIQHHNSAPGYVYYTWTLSAAGKSELAARREQLGKQLFSSFKETY
jgi:DNA-binding PadR family transcriptional regulator